MELQIVYLSPHELTPYEGNARKHGPVDIEQIKESIRVDGFNDPIGIWGDSNLIVEGHGRQIAAIEMGLDKVPCIRLDHMTDAQRRDYAIRHNRTAELSLWGDSLESELDRLSQEGFDTADLFDLNIEEETRQEVDRYTKATKIPQYDPRGGADIETLVKTDKVDSLIQEIEAANVTDEEKQFLKVAAYRHAVIDFDKVADYYSEASPEMQELMEKQALVLIDYQDAIANGYATLNSTIMEIMEEDEDE